VASSGSPQRKSKHIIARIANSKRKGESCAMGYLQNIVGAATVSFWQWRPMAANAREQCIIPSVTTDVDFTSRLGG